MDNQTVLQKEKQSEKLQYKFKDKPAVIKAALFFAAGLATSLLPEKFRISPFCAAAVGASPTEYAFMTFIGGSVGYIATRGLKSGFSFVILLGLILAAKTVFDRRFKTISRETVDPAFSGLFTLAVDLVKILLGEASVFAVCLAVSDALVCTAAVYFFSRSLSVPAFRLGLRKISGLDAACIVISGAAILGCLGGVSVASIYPARIFACLLIMFCASYKGVSAGAAVGVALGSVLCLGGNFHIFFMYSFASLLCSVFSPLGQYAIAASFTVAASASAVVYGLDSVSVYSVVECAVAATAFIAVPSKCINSAQELLTKSGLGEDNEVNRKVALDLKAAAKTVDEVTDIVAQVTKRMDGIINPELSRVYARIQREVCAECENKSVCWNKAFDSTVRDIEYIAQAMLEKLPVSDKLPNGLESRCKKIKELSREIDLDYKNYLSETDARIKMEEMRNVVSDQFSFVSQLLDDISTKIVGEKIYDINKSRSIKTALLENRIAVCSAAYWENSYSRAVAEVTVYDEPNRVDHAKIQKILSRTVGKEFKAAEISVVDLNTVLTFWQKSEYEITVAFAQVPFGENRVCGDKVETLDDVNGNSIAIISDGMGTGSRAAIDGTMTCSLMHKLIGSGFTFDSALRLVNSALIVKSRDESLATVDAVSINEYTGVCEFYKAGAAQSYVRSGDGLQVISRSSLPVGILRNVEFAKEELALKRGDIVLMLSDGVCGEDDSWIEDELLSWSTDNMHELAVHIANTAKKKNGLRFEDDISVVAMKVKRAK